MESIRDYFLKAAQKAGSYNKLSAALKTTCGNLNRISTGAGFPGDETILRLAAYLGEDPQKMLLLNQAERAPEGARGQWQTIMKKFAGAAAIAFIVATVLSSLPCLAGGAGPMYIMSNAILASILLLTLPGTPADRILMRA